MDRASLEQLSGQGLSLAEIGRRFGCHESTVAYSIRRHGLEAVHREHHAARGGLDRNRLAALVDAGMSIAQVAECVERGKATVRYWLKRHDLRTHAQEGRSEKASTHAARRAGKATVMRSCAHHGVTEFWLEGRGYYRCKRCRMDRVNQRRRKIKLILVAEAGGCCAVCGYERCISALHLHHMDPSTKMFNLSMQGVTRSLRRARAEMAKCILLCANCHAEVEAGLVELSGATGGGVARIQPAIRGSSTGRALDC